MCPCSNARRAHRLRVVSSSRDRSTRDKGRITLFPLLRRLDHVFNHVLDSLELRLLVLDDIVDAKDLGAHQGEGRVMLLDLPGYESWKIVHVAELFLDVLHLGLEVVNNLVQCCCSLTSIRAM